MTAKASHLKFIPASFGPFDLFSKDQMHEWRQRMINRSKQKKKYRQKHKEQENRRKRKLREKKSKLGR